MKSLHANAVVISIYIGPDGQPEVRIASDLPIVPIVINWQPGVGEECYVETDYGVAGVSSGLPDKIHEMNEADTQAVSRSLSPSGAS